MPLHPYLGDIYRPSATRQYPLPDIRTYLVNPRKFMHRHSPSARDGRGSHYRRMQGGSFWSKAKDFAQKAYNWGQTYKPATKISSMLDESGLSEKLPPMAGQVVNGALSIAKKLGFGRSHLAAIGRGAVRARGAPRRRAPGGSAHRVRAHVRHTMNGPVHVRAHTSRSGKGRRKAAPRRRRGGAMAPLRSLTRG